MMMNHKNQQDITQYGAIHHQQDEDNNGHYKHSENTSDDEVVMVEDIPQRSLRLPLNNCCCFYQRKKVPIWISFTLFVLGLSIKELPRAWRATSSNGKNYKYLSSSLLPLPSSGQESSAVDNKKEGSIPHFYKKQLVNHLDDDDGEDDPTYWTHRYYKTTKFFGGAGSPIFLVVGGEGALNNGMLYPFVTDVLAKTFGAAVIQPEHRFYGPYPPIRNASVDQLLDLLTPEQAMADMIRLVQVHLKTETDEFKNCSNDRSSPDYCPLITIGASYPGFLSAMFRFLYPDVVDAAHASSAPLLMYAQIPDNNVYYDIVTSAAENASPGCAHAVRTTLLDVVDEINSSNSISDAAEMVGICEDSIPRSVTTKQALADEIVTTAVYSFANFDMGCYPPGPDTGLYKICQSFQDPNMDSIETIKSFFNAMEIQDYEEENDCDLKYVHCDPPEVELEVIRQQNGGRQCFMLDSESDDAHAIVPETNDEYEYDDGYMWNFQTCSNLIFLAGQSKKSMFPPHNATYKGLTEMCQKQFGISPRPWELVEQWGFDDLVGNGASRILFANGMQDMWSGGSILEDLSDSLLALNFPNGAHHSELNHQGPTDEDTDDIKQGYKDIASILGAWMDEIKVESS